MPSIQHYDPSTTPALEFSPAAITHIKKHLHQKSGAIGFRLYVSEAGCSGLMYKVGYVIDVIPSDLMMMIDPDLTVYIDAKSYPFLKGTYVDLKKQGLNEVLTYQNPNAQAACGCGESFTVDHQSQDDV